MRTRLARLVIASAAAASLTGRLPAQTPTGAAPTAKTTAAAPRRTPAGSTTPTASQSAAARELFKSLKLRESIPNTATAMVDSEVSHNPGLVPYRDVMLNWLQKYMTWDAMQPELIQLYTNTYTEGELKAMAMFFASPVGQKFLVKNPEMLSKTAAIGARVSQPHQPELTTQLTARRDELKAQADARAPLAKGTPPAGAIPAGTPAARPAEIATPKAKTP